MNPSITKPSPDDDTHHSPVPAVSSPVPAVQSPVPAWGTWEDLLLAYAVNRYGSKNWDSISLELRKRSSVVNITPVYCEQKYDELKRRFTDQNDVVMDELRKLRVSELERELRNYDLYITSLQTKVKRLTEESEKTGDRKTTDAAEDTAVSGEENDSDRENQSVNGSNGNLEIGNGSGNGNINGNGGVTENERNDVEAVLIPVREGKGNGNGPEGSEPVKSEPESDLQSSASVKSINDRMPRGTKEDEDQSTDSVPVRSLPLVDFLHKVQKAGSVVLERRLDRQEKMRYKNLVKQHIDYETLQTRLKQGQYSDGNDKFYRDLLLLVANARIFFPKQSIESTAAVDLRQLILTEMSSKKKHKTDLKRPDSSLLKPKLSGPIVVCRKRSSITAKQTASKGSGSNPEKLSEQTGSGSFTLNNKKKGKMPVTEPEPETKPEKKKKLTEAEEKKQSAAKFLNRMKRSNESSDQAGKKSSGSGGKQVKEQGSPGKRSVGRPPKRAAAMPVLGKRNRESLDSESGSKQTKKRSKR
ncbi:uncharacterized protein LOC143634185 [Bidens hawaiensis]|uniref:uncharacterized protein LOC143634185 n=1 Tax=Bidens hawaiensis TaxID=980011 RepID=UPI00404ABE30